MSTNERITTLDGLTTAAKSVDNKHNLRSNEFRLVSSDGVLFTVSASTLHHLTVLWDLYEVAKGTKEQKSELVLTDEDFEHAKSVRLLLDFLVYGVVGHATVPINDIVDVIDLAQKYNCRPGYELCIDCLALLLVHKEMSYVAAGEALVLASELNDLRLAKLVVGLLAENQKKENRPVFESMSADWGLRVYTNSGPSWLAQLPPVFLWALWKALQKIKGRNATFVFPSPIDAQVTFEHTIDLHAPLASQKQLRGAERRAQHSWGRQ